MTALNDQIATLTADIAATRQKLTQNAAELVRVDALGEPARKTCQDAEALRQQRADILSQLIVSGSGKLTSHDLDTVDTAIDAARAGERRAEDLLSAQEGVLVNLRQQRTDLEQHLAKQTHAVLLAQHAAARDEIERDALPAVLAAAEALRVAFGRLAGLKSAHGVNADLIQERCGGNKPLSSDKYQVTAFKLQMHGVDFPVPHNYGTHEAGAECRSTCWDALHRWGTVGDEVPAVHESRIWPPLR